ncbi:MAG: S4 domain-containing protein [Desulfobacteraceae bacterium]|nr:S4 domain-containing protein [Desulfobacteraceae bacterium]
MNAENGVEVRIDKWLWAARFFKTRSSAAQAVTGGKVHLNGARTKPAKGVKTGDTLRIQREEAEFTVVVLGLSDKRGPARVAQALYEETEESRVARERQREERVLLAVERMVPRKRPGKRDRRLIRNFIRKDD